MIHPNVYGKSSPVRAAAETPALWVLREHLALTGAAAE
ncbi:aerobic-type carbon monoxide dehydrogenase small subunit (CoxS/CutS family) [Janthinobacterium sp. CG_23.3]